MDVPAVSLPSSRISVIFSSFFNAQLASWVGLPHHVLPFLAHWIYLDSSQNRAAVFCGSKTVNFLFCRLTLFFPEFSSYSSVHSRRTSREELPTNIDFLGMRKMCHRLFERSTKTEFISGNTLSYDEYLPVLHES